MSINTFRDFIVWQKSMILVKDIYAITKLFPADERFSLTSQIQRSAISVPSNIAEGFGRNHTTEFIRFLQISSGSLNELQTQLEIAKMQDYIGEQEYNKANDQAIEISRMLSSLILKLKNSKQIVKN